MTQLAALSITLAAYLLLAAACYGWGRAMAIVLRIGDRIPRSPFPTIWLGWAATLFILQLAHLVVPITAAVVIPIYLFGVALAVGPLRRALHGRTFAIGSAWESTLLVVGLAIVAFVWIASRAMLEPLDYDSGLYRFTAIRWVNSYPIVPGLGNLHGRLAFNQSFNHFVAALNLAPLFGHGRSLANSFLLLLAMAPGFLRLATVLRRPASLGESHPFSLVDLFTLPVCCYLALSSHGIPSPIPDLTSTILQLVLFAFLAEGIVEIEAGEEDQRFRAAVIVFLAATAVTVKLSNLGFAFAIVVLVLAYTLRTSARRVAAAVRLMAPAAVLTVLWLVRGAILSGAPLYPSTIGYLPVSWAVPKTEVAEMAGWVYSWARMPGHFPKDVLGSWKWVPTWWIGITTHRLTDIVYPAIWAAAIGLLAVVAAWAGRAWPRAREASILAPPLVSVVYWFFTAPDPRFAHASIFLAAIGASLLFLRAVPPKLGPRGRAVLAAVVLVGLNVRIGGYFGDNSESLRWVSTSGWQPVREVPIRKLRNLAGLVLYVPERGDQTWDAPLPATPYMRDRLRLRRPDDLASGFVVSDP